MQTLFLGKLYELRKKRAGAPTGNKNTDKNEGVTVTHSFSTAEKIAEEQGVSSRTVERAGKVAEAYKEASDKIKEEFVQGKISQKELVHLSKAPEPIDEPVPLKNPHINNIRHHGNRISQAVKDLQVKLADY